MADQKTQTNEQSSSVAPPRAPGQNPQQAQIDEKGNRVGGDVDERGNAIPANDPDGRRPGGQPFREDAPGAPVQPAKVVTPDPTPVGDVPHPQTANEPAKHQRGDHGKSR
jgi:hypothetical protein